MRKLLLNIIFKNKKKSFFCDDRKKYNLSSTNKNVMITEDIFKKI